MAKGDLAQAIVTSLLLWANPHYRQFLGRATPGRLDNAWFDWFVGEWGVARTIKTSKRSLVRQHLDVIFRRELASGKGADAVDDAAQLFQANRWSAGKRKDGTASLPLSLVSKIGFFFRPHELVPYDNHARRGLEKLHNMGGEGKFAERCYCHYLTTFNGQFSFRQRQLREALTEPWVSDLAEKLGCPEDSSASLAMQRKTFDSYLMLLGRRTS